MSSVDPRATCTFFFSLVPAKPVMTYVDDWKTTNPEWGGHRVCMKFMPVNRYDFRIEVGSLFLTVTHVGKCSMAMTRISMLEHTFADDIETKQDDARISPSKLKVRGFYVLSNVGRAKLDSKNQLQGALEEIEA